MTRRGFVLSAVSMPFAASFGETFRASSPTRDLALLQSEIDEVSESDYLRYLKGDGSAGSLIRKYQALARLDDVVDRVIVDLRNTVIDSRPAVWYIYNMGIVVKTRESVFSVDLCHRRSEELAPLLDFAIITHNHDDHFTRRFYEKMDGELHKTVITNFADNYGAAFNGGLCGFARGEKTFEIKDVTVRTMESDHNRFLRGFTMPVEITTGDYTILHVGDTVNAEALRVTRKPNLWIHHAYCWGLVSGKGAAALKPDLTVVMHLQEMAHSRGKSRWTFEDGRKAVAVVESVGGCAIMPLWGDRLV